MKLKEKNPATVIRSYRIKPEVFRQFLKAARRENRSASAQVTHLIVRYLQRKALEDDV